MSRVSYFQRFSQPENHATNNTLLVLRHFYQASPFKIERILTSLLNTELSIGLTFEQQIRGDNSVPDALISQKPLRIFVETKRGGGVDPAQIDRHISSITSPANRGTDDTLICLTKEPLSDAQVKMFEIKASSKGVKFSAVTFSQIVAALKEQCSDFDLELQAIAEDYESFLAEDGLLERRNHYLFVPLCGTSLPENERFHLYYEPVARPVKHHRYLGLYNKKAVRFVGTVEAVATGSVVGGVLEIEEVQGPLKEEHKKRITDIVDTTSIFDLTVDAHRFYLVDSFIPTNAVKTTSRGIQGLRYLDLNKLVHDYDPRRNYTSAELAEALNSATWQ